MSVWTWVKGKVQDVRMATYDPAKESVKEIVSQVPGVDITGTKIDSGAGDVSGFTPTGRGGRGGGRGTPTTPYEVEPGETPVTVELIPSIPSAPSAPPPAPKTISAQMEEVETIKGEEYTRGQLIELGMEGDLKRMGGETQSQYEARLVGYGKGIAYGYPTQAQTFVTGGVTISRGVEEDLLYKKEELLEKIRIAGIEGRTKDLQKYRKELRKTETALARTGGVVSFGFAPTTEKGWKKYVPEYKIGGADVIGLKSTIKGFQEIGEKWTKGWEFIGKKTGVTAEMFGKISAEAAYPKWMYPTMPKEVKKFQAGMVTGVLLDIKYHPYKQVALYGLGVGIGYGVSATTAVVATVGGLIAGGIAKGGLIAGGVGVTGYWGYGKGKEIILSPSWEKKGAITGVALKDVGLMGFGAAKGEKMFQETVGLWRTRGMPESKILTQKAYELKTTFPEAGKGLRPYEKAKLHKGIFEKGEAAEFFKEPGKLPPGFHMAEQPLKGLEITRPLHIASEPSIHFLGVKGGEYRMFPRFKGFFRLPAKPTGYAITPKSYKALVGYEVTRGKYIWTKSVKGTAGLIPTEKAAYFIYKGVRIPVYGIKAKGIAYVPGTKPEVQAVFEVGKALGVSKLSGKPSPSIVELPSYSIVSPKVGLGLVSYKPSYKEISYKPSYKISYKQPSRVSLSLKPSKVSYAPSLRVSPPSYKPSYKISDIVSAPSYKPSYKISDVGKGFVTHHFEKFDLDMPEGRRKKVKIKRMKPTRKTKYVPTLAARHFKITAPKIPRTYEIGAGGLGGRPIIKKAKKKRKRKK